MWGSQTTTGFTCFRMQGVPGDCRRLAPTKTFLLSCEIDLGRQVDVPAACDIVYSTSRALFPYSYIFLSSLCTGVLAAILEREARSQVQGVPWIRSLTPTAREPGPLEDPPAYFPFDASAES